MNGGNSCQKPSFSYPSIFHHVLLNLSSTGRFSINIIWLNFTTLQVMIFSNSTGRFSIHIIWLKFTTLQEIIFSNFIQLKFTRKSLYSIHLWILNCYHCCLNIIPCHSSLTFLLPIPILLHASQAPALVTSLISVTICCCYHNFNGGHAFVTILHSLSLVLTCNYYKT